MLRCLEFEVQLASFWNPDQDIIELRDAQHTKYAGINQGSYDNAIGQMQEPKAPSHQGQ